MIALIYNLADTYFVGLLNSPTETASVTVVYPIFVMLIAISNLFGIGGASAVSRALGKKDTEKAKSISSISVYMSLISGILFSILFLILSRPILTLCGARDDVVFKISSGYAKYMVVYGGVFTILNNVLANLVRADGSALHASIGVSLGGIINIILDPLFVLPELLNLGAVGAGIATGISNFCAALYFVILICIKKGIVNFDFKRLKDTKKYISEILKIGFPSAIQYALTVVAIAAQSRFVSNYDTEAIAALGIVKKLDQLPLYFSIGVSSGLLPLLAYNHASGDIDRRKKSFKTGLIISLAFSIMCLVVYEIFAPYLIGLFISDTRTISYGAMFLRIMVTAMPMMSVCYPMIIQFQAMGKAKESLICSILRKGVLDIPLLFIMNAIFPLYGLMLVQPIVDSISLIVATHMMKKIH